MGSTSNEKQEDNVEKNKQNIFRWKIPIRLMLGVILVVAGAWSILNPNAQFYNFSAARQNTNVESEAIPEEKTTQSPQNFKWQPLNNSKSIRILGLAPAAYKPGINIFLMNLDPPIQDKIQYEALSYAWGNPNLTHEINCNGHSMKITANLYFALWHLQYQKQFRYLWIDAISIDQTNNTEKQSYILMLNEVFSNATRVIGWLGPEGQDSGYAMEATFNDDSYEEISENLREYTNDRQLTALFSLLTRRWFSRGWMMQEVALAKDIIIQCGFRTMTWERLVTAARVLSGLLHQSHSDLVRYHELDGILSFANFRLHYQQNGVIPISYANEKMRHFQVTDPRDRIYSILGLIDEHYRDNIKPDYSLEPWEVYRDVSRVMIQGPIGLSILSMADPRHPMIIPDEVPKDLRHFWPNISDVYQRTQKLPTWAFDWIHIPYIEGDLGPLHFLGKIIHSARDFNASLGTNIEIYSKTDPNLLVLDGKRIGSITDLNRAFQSDFQTWRELAYPDESVETGLFTAWMSMYGSYQEYFEDEDIYEPTGESAYEALWRTTVANSWSGPVRSLSRIPFAPPRHMVKWLHEWLLILARDNQTDRYRWKAVESDQWMFDRKLRGEEALTADETVELFGPKVFWVSMVEGLINRSFCFIAGKVIGLCPPTAKEGDVLVLFYGAKIPYVLRPVESPNGKPRYELVGEAYVHGFMNGEALSRDDMPDDTFVIQ